MRKVDYTVQEICRGSSIMQKSEMASISSLVYECPSCHQHAFSFDDDYRIDYLRMHVEAINHAIEDGVDVRAYTTWGNIR